MSLELYVAIHQAAACLAGDLQASADRLHMPLVVPAEFALADASGFQPFQINGMESGVEVWRDSSSEVFARSPGFREAAGARDQIIVFRWGGSLLEGAIALGLAAVVTEGCDGIAYDPQAGASSDTRALVDGFDELLELSRKDES